METEYVGLSQERSIVSQFINLYEFVTNKPYTMGLVDHLKIKINLNNTLAKKCRRNVILKRVRVTTVAVEKQLRFTYSQSELVALVFQSGKRARLVILSCVACLALPYFSALSHKGTNFEKELLKTKYLLCFSVQILSETSHSKKK